MNYDEALGRLVALGDTPDPDQLDGTVEPLERAMRTDDPQGYVWFVAAVCDRLNSRDLGDWRRQDQLVGKYARVALRHASVLPPVAELRLLEHLMAVPEDDRREFAERWLTVLGRVQRELDPAFDPADVPLLNVPVPVGVADEHAQVRQQRYDHAISQNRAHAELYARQVEARRLLSRYRPPAQRFLVATYAQDLDTQNPESAAELDELLAQHGADEDWAAAVRAAMHQQRRG